MSKKILIHEFDPKLYPVKLWITNSTKNKFNDFEELDEFESSSIADVQKAYNKVDKSTGFIIRFRTKKEMNAEVITHEASHVAIMICDYIGAPINLDSQEYFAYLAGWVSDCCYQVKTNKFKN